MEMAKVFSRSICTKIRVGCITFIEPTNFHHIFILKVSYVLFNRGIIDQTNQSAVGLNSIIVLHTSTSVPPFCASFFLLKRTHLTSRTIFIYQTYNIFLLRQWFKKLYMSTRLEFSHSNKKQQAMCARTVDLSPIQYTVVSLYCVKNKINYTWKKLHQI